MFSGCRGCSLQVPTTGCSTVGQAVKNSQGHFCQGEHVTDHPSWQEGRLLCCWHWKVDLQTL